MWIHYSKIVFIIYETRNVIKESLLITNSFVYSFESLIYVENNYYSDKFYVPL